MAVLWDSDSLIYCFANTSISSALEMHKGSHKSHCSVQQLSLSQCIGLPKGLGENDYKESSSRLNLYYESLFASFSFLLKLATSIFFIKLSHVHSIEINGGTVARVDCSQEE